MRTATTAPNRRPRQYRLRHEAEAADGVAARDWFRSPTISHQRGRDAQPEQVHAQWKPSGTTYTINGVIYAATEVGSLDAAVISEKQRPTSASATGVPSTAPVSDIGLGVMSQGSPRSKIDVTCGTTARSPNSKATRKPSNPSSTTASQLQVLPVVPWARLHVLASLPSRGSG